MLGVFEQFTILLVILSLLSYDLLDSCVHLVYDFHNKKTNKFVEPKQAAKRKRFWYVLAFSCSHFQMHMPSLEPIRNSKRIFIVELRTVLHHSLKTALNRNITLDNALIRRKLIPKSVNLNDRDLFVRTLY